MDSKSLIDTVDKNRENRARYRVLISGAAAVEESPKSWTLSFPCAVQDILFEEPTIQVSIPRQVGEAADRHLLLSVGDHRGRLAVARLYVGEESSTSETDALQLLLGMTAVGLPHQPDAVLGIGIVAALHLQTPLVLGHVHPSYRITHEALLSAVEKMGSGELLAALARSYDVKPIEGVHGAVIEALQVRRRELIGR